MNIDISKPVFPPTDLWAGVLGLLSVWCAYVELVCKRVGRPLFNLQLFPVEEHTAAILSIYAVASMETARLEQVKLQT
jgi:hypothetical protein